MPKHPGRYTLQADLEGDVIYDRLRADFGEASPKASGYLSEYSFLRERALVLDAIGDEPGIIVDIACGAGLITLPLVRAGSRVVGVDFNEAACKQAGRNGLYTICCSAFSLPLADAVADTVVNIEFAQQYSTKAVERMLNEAAHVLRPSGRLVLVWSNRAAVVHRVLSAVIRPLERLRGRAWFQLIDHTPRNIRTAGKLAGLTLDAMYAIFPPLRLRLRRIDSPLVKVLGSSFVAIFRKRPTPQGRSRQTSRKTKKE